MGGQRLRAETLTLSSTVRQGPHRLWHGLLVAEDLWTTDDVATFLGVQRDTVSSYRSRQQMPKPDRTFGRTPLWRPETIKMWAAARPSKPTTG